MTEKQLFYPLLSVYFSLILGDLQKEKLQIVSIFRFGHKKRGLFQCPREGWGGAFGLPPASSGNSDGVAISQPRVAGEARYPG